MQMLKKILVVDDEEDIRLYLSRLLQENGFAVTVAANGDEAWQAVAKGCPDLITLDLSMPETTGVKFYRMIKAQSELSSIPVVFVTGVTGVGGSRDTERFYSTRKQVPPPDGFIAKPIDATEVVNLVKSLTSGERGKAAGSSASV